MAVLEWSAKSNSKGLKKFQVTEVHQWSWTTSKLNVADNAIRDKEIELQVKSKWLVGPEFLYHCIYGLTKIYMTLLMFICQIQLGFYHGRN